MTMSASEMSVCYITERRLCPEPLVLRTEKLLAAGADYVMLREKDLTENELLALAEELKKTADKFGRRLIINGNPKVAAIVGAWAAHLPFRALPLAAEVKAAGLKLGGSVHNAQEGRAAREAGADYVLAGHIFESDCKKGLPGRGTELITELKTELGLPVWAVGGLNPENVNRIRAAGASVAACRSLLNQAADPQALLEAFRAGRGAAD